MTPAVQAIVGWASAAMDKYGNILIGYSVADSASALKPSIAVAGRSQCDTLNTLQAEQIAVTGTGSQTGTLSRWGDYSTMQVDPLGRYDLLVHCRIPLRGRYIQLANTDRLLQFSDHDSDRQRRL